MKYQLNETAVVSKTSNGAISLRTGTAKNYEQLELSHTAICILNSMLTEEPSWSRQELVDIACRYTDADRAEQFVDYLIEKHVVVADNEDNFYSPLYELWSEYGWTDAAVHYLSCYGAEFTPDDSGGAQYSDVYELMLTDDTVIEQPPACKGIPETHLLSIPFESAVENCNKTVGNVLESIIQVYAYEPHQINLRDVHKVVAETFANQRYIETGLGPTPLRSYPSGGARHPIEVYIVAKEADEYPSGVYYFEPDSRMLYLIEAGHNIADRIDNACFLKRGVRSSKFEIILSVRWLRHMWKYRYARSYKMVLMEVGHAMQSLEFVSNCLGFQTYYCPSFNDSVVNELCHLDDPFEENAAVVIGIGRNGLTLEEYRERYDTSA